MCGIAGILRKDGKRVSRNTLKAMTAAIAHRGPDGEGIYALGHLGLGHRRLAIIDTSEAGRQPMESEDGDHVISYNGEVYNYRELRKELEELGWTFRSNTDTEVVLKSLAQWGAAAVERFNGMFALAYWNDKKGELLLARDRYGIKPLYYVDLPSCTAFASEAKAILAVPEYQIDLDKEALVEYFTFQNLFTDRSLFKDIRMLPAGCTLRLKRGSSSHLQRYWDYNFQEPLQVADEREYLEELDRLFVQAVERQLVSDVEIGSYLSGGIDSGSITGIASKLIPYIKSFTVGFDCNAAQGMEIVCDERKVAEAMGSLFRTEHYEMVLKAGDMERCLPKLAYHLEEPRVGQSYPNYYAAYLASRFVKVVLSGTGGDELFGGYPWRYYRAAVNTDFEDYIDKYYVYWQRLIPNRDLHRVFAPIRKDVHGVWTRDIFHDVFVNPPERLDSPEAYVNHSLYFEAKTFLHGLLVVEDKLSMAHGLETRVPFLDNDLVDFAMRVPVSLKLAKLDELVRLNENQVGRKTSNYYQRTNDGKVLLRKALSRHVPEEISQQEKQGFSAPDASWFKGESIDFVKRYLHRSDAAIFDYFDRDATLELVQEHLDGKQNRRLLIWSLLNFEQFCQTYLDNHADTHHRGHRPHRITTPITTA